MLTTHYLEEAEALADRVAVIDTGSLVGLDTPAALVRAARAASRSASGWPPPGRRAPRRCRNRCAARGATLDPSGATVICPVDSTPIGELLALAGALSPAGGRRGDVQPSLEEVFLQLTKRPDAASFDAAIVMNGIGFRTLLAKETRRFLQGAGADAGAAGGDDHALLPGVRLRAGRAGARGRRRLVHPLHRPGPGPAGADPERVPQHVVVDVHRQDAGDDRRSAGRAVWGSPICWPRSSPPPCCAACWSAASSG